MLKADISSENILEKAKLILEKIGFEISENDLGVLTLCAKSAHKLFLEKSGLKSIPESAFEVVAFFSAGEFLSSMKSLCRLDGFLPDLSNVKSFSEGDASFSFRDEEAPLETLIRFLKRAGDFNAYRRLRW